MRPAMAVMEMQAQESNGSQGHQHLWLEKDPGWGKELEAAFGAFLGDQLGLVTKCQRQTVLGSLRREGAGEAGRIQEPQNLAAALHLLIFLEVSVWSMKDANN